MPSPQKVHDMYAWKIYRLVYQTLCGIKQSGGYNYSPFVTDKFNDFTQAVESQALYLVCPDHGTDLVGVGGSGGGGGGTRKHQVVSFIVNGLSIYDTETAAQAAFALEQDVRTAIDALATKPDGADTALRRLVGVGCFVRWEQCSYAHETIMPKNEAGFELGFSITYPQGTIW